MNCDTIDSILDDHRAARLSAPERQSVAAHLAACGRCAGGWAAHDSLAGENMGEPPPQLLAAVLRRVAEARVEPPAVRRRMWMAVAAVAAAAAVAMVALVTRDPVVVPVASSSNTPPATVAADLAVPRFIAGRDYEVLASPSVATATTGKVEVVEFFMYECGWCYTFEPELSRWDAAAREYVAVIRVPAIFSANAELHARAYYTAAALGKLDAMHAAFYEQIHERGNSLLSGAALAKLFASFGVDAGMFDAVFNSKEVDAEVERARELARAYNIRATPTLVVAGRYSTDPGLAGAAMLDVVDQLVADERAARAER